MMSELGHLLTDPAHWVFEGVADTVFFATGWVIGRVPMAHWITRHNRRHEHDTG